jgi:hypothetical protein
MARSIADYLFLASFFLTPAALFVGFLYVLAQRLAQLRTRTKAVPHSVEVRAH